MNQPYRVVAVEQKFQHAAALHEQGELDQAEQAYTEVIICTLHKLALLSIQKNKYEDAVAFAREVLRLRPDSAMAYDTQGSALMYLNRLEEAAASYQRAVELAPDYVEAYNNLSTVLKILGRIDEARQVIEAAIGFAPGSADLYARLAELKHFVDGDAHVAGMEELARQMTLLSGEEQLRLHFALGKALADLGRHEQSFCHLLAGNGIKRRQIVYDEAAVLQAFDRTRAVFTPKLMKDNEGVGHRTSIPVFILGMPRSGTTLVEQVLASHPKVFGAGEVPYFADAVAQLCGSGETPSGFPDAVPFMAGEQLRQLGTAYLERISAAAPGAQRITDKMPANFRFGGLIHLALPNARIIHCRRDPIDNCLSCFSLLFDGDQPHTYELGELGRYYRGYARLMDHWRGVLPKGVMLDVDYEGLVTDFERHAQQILAHCGLEWDDACLAFYKTQRPVRTSMIQVRRPIYRSSIGRWRSYRKGLEPLLASLEVDPPDDPTHRPSRPHEGCNEETWQPAGEVSVK